MRKAIRLAGAIVGCVALIATSVALGADWPQWRGANRDGTVTGFTAPETWPKALKEVWKTTVGSGIATPAVVGDRVYVFTRQGADEIILCLNAADGKEVWRSAYPAQAVTGASARHDGPRSSPTVTGGKVVALGVGGVLSCLNAADGALAWRKDPFPKVVPQFFTAMSPMVADGLVIAHLGGRGKGALIAYDLATGDEKWQWTGAAPAYASPVLMTVEGTKQVVTMTENSVVGIAAADGKLLWQLPFVPSGRGYNAATPIVTGQTVIYTGAGRGTRAVKVEKTDDGFAATQVWSNPDVAVQFNTPVLKDGLLFGFTDRGNLFCLKAEDGKTAWTDEKRQGGGFGAVLDAGAVVLALPSSSELIAFKPDAAKYDEVARLKVADSPTYAHPVVLGQRILVRDKDSLIMWSLE